MRRASLRTFAAALALALPSQLAANVKPPDLDVVDETIDVRLVNVEAVVTDKAGRRIHGLGAADLRLLVDGREVPIEHFTEVEDGRNGQGAEAAGDPVARNYLLYIDESFSLETRRDALLDRMAADLDLLQPGDRMAVLSFDGRKIDVLSGWTGDVALLRSVLARARLRPALGTRTLTSQRSLDNDVRWAKEVFADTRGGSRVGGGGDGGAEGAGDGKDELNAVLADLALRTPLEARTQLGRTDTAIAAALNGFAAPAGRKVLLYLTGAWSFDVDPYLFPALIEVANRTGYTLYPVDTAKSSAEQVTAFDHLAQATGGRALVSRTDEVFRQAVADSGSYYWLGFSPAWSGNDRGHRIEVEVKRPGLQARSRSGFADLSRRTETAFRAEGILLFGGALEDRRLIVQAGAIAPGAGRPHRRAAKTVQVPITLGVPVESLAFTRQGKGYAAEVPLAIEAEDGQRRRAGLPPLRLRVTLDEIPKAGTFARFRTVLQLPNAGQRLVFTVQDPATGKTLWGQTEIRPEPAPAKVSRR